MARAKMHKIDFQQLAFQNRKAVAVAGFFVSIDI
jgi:hypothetical protein